MAIDRLNDSLTPEEETMLIVGLISGTSADGIDAAICEVSGAPPSIEARLVHGVTIPYAPDLRTRVLGSYEPGRSSIDELCRLNFDIGTAFASAVAEVCEAEGTPVDSIDLVVSHGQTVWHEVIDSGSVHSTLQFGEPAVVAQHTGVTTIGNLRSRDVAAGGQGAPLAGYVDWLLLRDPQRFRAVQNIGGIGNVTFVPPLTDPDPFPLAFDTGPGNALIDDVLRLSSNGQIAFDANGELARQGEVDQEWLTILLDHPYYKRDAPKTTGRELFGADMATELLSEARRRGLSLVDTVATLTQLTAASIADAYRRFAPRPVDQVVVGGGGRHNQTLMEMLATSVDPAEVVTQEDIGFDSDFKEALLCAVIGYETWHGRSGNHPRITGASEPVVMGQISPGNNYESLVRETWCE